MIFKFSINSGEKRMAFCATDAEHEERFSINDPNADETHIFLS